MKKIFLLSVLAIVALGISAVSCKIYVNGPENDGSGKSGEPASDIFVSKTLEVESIDKIDMSSLINVIFIQDDKVSAELIAPDNVMEYYRYKAGNGSLKVWKEGDKQINYGKTNAPKLIIHSPGLKSVKLSGASSFVAKNLGNKNGNVGFTLSGASNVAVENLECADLSVNASGASGFKVAKVNAGDVSVDCSGASNATMVIEDAQTVDVDCSGASGVKLAGKAVKVNYDCSGASSIKAKELVAETGSMSASGVSSVKGNIKKLKSKDASGMSKASNKSDEN